jgi:hypothetical protein
VWICTQSNIANIICNMFTKLCPNTNFGVHIPVWNEGDVHGVRYLYICLISTSTQVL